MDRLTIRSEYLAQRTVDGLYKDLERRIVASPPGQCPAEMTASFWNFAIHKAAANAYRVVWDWGSLDI